MPQAAPKSSQISNELIDMLMSRMSVSEMEFYRYIRDIEHLNDKAAEDYLKALANAVYGRKEVAIAFFEEALKQNIDIIAQNYVVYLNDYGSYRQVQELVDRLVMQYRSKTMLGHAWETNLFMGEVNKAISYAEDFIKIVDAKEAEAMKQVAASALAETTLFKKNTGISDDDYVDIAVRVVDVMDAHRVSPVALSFHSIPEENTASYVMSVNTLDADILSDMNLDIAFSLAENDSLAGKKFSVWFEGTAEDSQRVRQ